MLMSRAPEFFFFFKFLHYLFKCLCMSEYICMWETVRAQPAGVSSLLHHVGSGNQTQAISVGTSTFAY